MHPRAALVNEGRMNIKALIASVALLALGTSVAGAADLPVKSAPPLTPIAVLNWTGFYGGINLGGAWVHNTWTDTVFGTTFNNRSNGAFLAGAQFGGNYQIGSFVIGGEADFDWASNRTGT